MSWDRQWRFFEQQPEDRADWPVEDGADVERFGDPILVYDNCNGFSLWCESDAQAPPAEWWITLPITANLGRRIPNPEDLVITSTHEDENFRAFVQSKVSADREAKITLDEGFAAYQAFTQGRGADAMEEPAFADALRQVAFSARGVQIEDRFLGLKLS